MLLLSPGTSLTQRGQGTFVSDDEIGRVMATVGTNEPQYAKELVNLQPAASGDSPAKGPTAKDRDELYEAAVEVVIREGRGSVSLLQRALGVGYGRGARMVDFMAEDGIVGQYAGSQAREVLMTMEEWAAAQGEEPLPPDPPPRRLKINPHAEETVPDDEHEDEPIQDDEPSIVAEVDVDEEDGEEHSESEDGDVEDDEEYEYVYEDDEEGDEEEYEEDEEEDDADE